MGKRGSKGPKDPFESLDDEFKDKAAAASTDELRAMLAKIALDDAQNLAAQAADQDLKEKKQAAADAAAVYRDGTKANRLRTKYVTRVLADRGQEQPQKILELEAAKV